MFYYVSGPVADIGPGLAVIDCGGVGYACATTNYTLSQLKKGTPAKLYTYLNVREDAMELFGFADQSELRSFKLLISVSGVGPRAGKGSVPMAAAGLPHSKKSEATAALAVLGYGSAEIAAALKGIDMDALSLEDIIRQALKKMMK